jgi:hypothetical protein
MRGPLKLISETPSFGVQKGTVLLRSTTLAQPQEFPLTVTSWQPDTIDVLLPARPQSIDLVYRISVRGPQVVCILDQPIAIGGDPLCTGLKVEPEKPNWGDQIILTPNKSFTSTGGDVLLTGTVADSTAQVVEPLPSHWRPGVQQVEATLPGSPPAIRVAYVISIHGRDRDITCISPQLDIGILPPPRPSGRVRCRVWASGFQVRRQTWDHALEVDGKGDEVYWYVPAVVVELRSRRWYRAKTYRSKVLGDVNEYPQRIKAGGASDKGG